MILSVNSRSLVIALWRNRTLAHGFQIPVRSLPGWPCNFGRFSIRGSLQICGRLGGVCLQATDYSCGPAAAVTALRRLGIPAGEGEIAILAHTSNAIGTPSDLLATAIQKRFGPQGVDCRYRSYRSVQELRQGAPAITLAVIRFSLFVDHYVAVLHVDETRVVVGDPAKGLRAYTIGDFERIWKHTGVQIQRGHAPTTSQPGAKSL